MAQVEAGNLGADVVVRRAHAEAEGRRTALRDLATAARHALVAACSPEVWPPE